MATDKVNTLRKTLSEKVTDPFDNGDVIRWVSVGRYAYAAIKTPVGWFTTARGDNRFVEKQVDYEGLVEILSMSDVTDVEIAGEWETI